MDKALASQGDMTENKTSITEIGKSLNAFTVEGIQIPDLTLPPARASQTQTANR